MVVHFESEPRLDLCGHTEVDQSVDGPGLKQVKPVASRSDLDSLDKLRPDRSQDRSEIGRIAVGTARSTADFESTPEDTVEDAAGKAVEGNFGQDTAVHRDIAGCTAAADTAAADTVDDRDMIVGYSQELANHPV